MNLKTLLPYNPDIDEKTAMKEAMKIWAWLKDTGLDKTNHPTWHTTIKSYYYYCPLCSAFRNDDECNECPLVQNSIPCHMDGCAFSMWAMTDKRGDDDTKKAAERVYNEIAEAYKQRYGVEYNPYKQ